MLLEAQHNKVTFDTIKAIIDSLVPFDVWEKAIKQHNKGKNKNDLVEDGWKAPVTSYLKLISKRLNDQGYKTQRGTITVPYLLSFIRSEGDDGLHYLFGDRAFLSILPYLWGYVSEVKTKLMALLSIKKTHNFEKNKCSKNIRTVSERLKVALDNLQGLSRVTYKTSRHKIRPKPKVF